jgi:hypothetical protein
LGNTSVRSHKISWRKRNGRRCEESHRSFDLVGVGFPGREMEGLAVLELILFIQVHVINIAAVGWFWRFPRRRLVSVAILNNIIYTVNVVIGV